MSTSSPLYSRDVLALAVELAAFPLDPAAVLQGEARARVCGSRVLFSGRLDAGRISAPGLRVTACAVGQAAAAIFASAVTGVAATGLPDDADRIEAWLAGAGPMPDWPRLDLLVPALPHSARHPAILLPWRAAADALSKAGMPG